MPKMRKPLPMQPPMHPSNTLRNLSRIAPFQRKSPGVIQGFFCPASVAILHASRALHQFFRRLLFSCVHVNLRGFMWCVGFFTRNSIP